MPIPFEPATELALYKEGLIRMTVAALIATKNFNDSEPDVGMAPSLEMLLDRVEESARIVLDADEREKVLLQTRRRIKA